MLRKAVCDVTDIPYSKIRFGRTDKGKPFLQSDVPSSLKNLSFNVSHQGDLVVLAAEKDTLVGIDVMKLDTPSKYCRHILDVKNQIKQNSQVIYAF